MILLAAIVFGPLGPVKVQTYHDAVVTAEVRYRIASNALYDKGPAGLPPSIAAGSVSITVAGRRRTIDFARLFPIADNIVVLAENPPSDGCGVAQTFARHGHFLAIEAVLALKGCAPIAAVIDLDTEEVASFVAVDHPSDYHYTAEPLRFLGKPYVVNRVETVMLKRSDLDMAHPSLIDWPFAVVHATPQDGKIHEFVFEIADVVNPAAAMASLPTIGSRIEIGRTRPYPAYWTLRHVLTEPFMRLSALDEQTFVDRLPARSQQDERAFRRGIWLQAADNAAAGNRFDTAVADLANMLTYEDDPTYVQSDTATLQVCRALAIRVHHGEISPAAASASFTTGCTPAATANRKP